MSIITALKKMATSSKKVAASLADRYGEGGQYYRFNVDQGLQDITLPDWEKASTISAYTRNYLSDNQRAIKNFVDNFTKAGFEGDNIETSQTAAAAAELSGARNNGVAGPWYHVPFPRNKHFVGRDETLGTLRDKLFVRQSPTVALVGLGGVGKTQVALELAFWTKENKSDFSVYWVPALSQAAFEQAYADIASQLEIRRGDDQDVKESVRQYLSSEAAGRWLFIVDNADDRDVLFGSQDTPGVSKYLPKSDAGLTLFTARSRHVAMSIADEVVELHEMSPQEAKVVLQRWPGLNSSMDDDAVVTELLQELTFLPLAITQAAAYLYKTGVPMTKYLKLLRGTEKDMVSLMSREFRDNARYEGSQNAVATTWLVSFEQIRREDGNAAELLSFMSQIEPKAIPQSLLPKLESEEQMAHAIGTLCGYAFVAWQEDEVLDMHSLVHLATRIWVEREGLAALTAEKALRHVAEIFPSTHYANRNTWRAYVAHALQLLYKGAGADVEGRYDLCFSVGQCLRVDGRIKEAVGFFEECCEWRESRYAEEHPSRLASQYQLAVSCRHDGQVAKAVRLLEHIVAVEAKILAEADHSRLISQHALAGAYQANGEVGKAVELLEHVVAVEAMTLTEEHPTRLASQNNLGRAYLAGGQVERAVKLLEHVVAMREKTLPEQHPDRLKSQQTLAGAYEAAAEVKKAVELFEHVVAIYEETLAEHHPDRLASQHELATAYLANKQTDKAVELLEHVVAVEARTLTEEHPTRLASQNNLGGAYLAGGQVERAVKLLEHVVAMREKTLAEQHPDRLASQQLLSVAYTANDQTENAVELLEHIIPVLKKTLAEDSHELLVSQHMLAVAYQKDGQIKRAIELLEPVAAVKDRTLPEEHPSRLVSQYVLARAYQADGQIQKAVGLLEQVVAVQERTLAEDHPSRLASQHNLAIAYQADGQMLQAVELLKHVVALESRTLQKDDPDRLASLSALENALAVASQ